MAEDCTPMPTRAPTHTHYHDHVPGTLCLCTNEVFQEFILLRTDVSEDLWHQILEFFGLTGSSDDKEVFTNGELDYTGRNEPTEPIKDINSVQKPNHKACYLAWIGVFSSRYEIRKTVESSKLTLRSFEMNNGIVVFEHVQFFNITERLYAWKPWEVTTDSTATYRISWWQPSTSYLPRTLRALLV